MDLSIRHQIKHTKSDIKEFKEMVADFSTKNVAWNTDINIRGKLFPYYIYSNEEMLL